MSKSKQALTCGEILYMQCIASDLNEENRKQREKIKLLTSEDSVVREHSDWADDGDREVCSFAELKSQGRSRIPGQLSTTAEEQ